MVLRGPLVAWRLHAMWAGVGAAADISGYQIAYGSEVLHCTRNIPSR